MKRLFKNTFLILLILAVFQGYRIAQDSGLLVKVEPHFSGACDPVTGIVGAEDITIDLDTNYAYISADDRRAVAAKKFGVSGIYGLDLNDPNARPEFLTGDYTEEFHPHGISYFKDADGRAALFVVTHLSNGNHQVVVFDIENPNQLTPRPPITFPDLIEPNDIAAVSLDRFYVTSDHRYPRGTEMHMAEDYLGLPMAGVSYYDGQNGRNAAMGLRYANGINYNPDKNQLFVAETTARQITVYDINPSDGSLDKAYDFDLPTAPDNLEWDSRGNLWAAGHPNLFDFVAHIENAGNKSPSQVIKVNTKTQPPLISEVYLNDGNEISGSSVAAVSGKTMLIGSVYEEHILRCSL